MKTKFFYHILLLMFLTADAKAQQTSLPARAWRVAGELPAFQAQPQALGVAGPVAGVHNDVLLVAGGANFPEGAPWLGGKKKYYREGFVFRKDRNGVLVKTADFSLPLAVGYSANCTTPFGIVAAGGEMDAGLLSSVLLLQWNKESQAVVFSNLPPLPFAVTNAAIAFYNNKLYLAGGERAEAVSQNFLVLDMADTSAGWNTLPSIPKPVSHAVPVVQHNGSEQALYLVGGRKRNPGGLSELSASVYVFDLIKGAWVEKAPLPYALSAGTGMAAGKQSILLFGGDTGETFHQTESLIAAIANETDESKKQSLNNEKITVQSSHPGFCKQVLIYHTKKDKWEEAGCIPFSAPVTTTAVGWNGEVILPSGEIKAGVRTPYILSADLTGLKDL
ncbi:hypothetical protein HRG84_20605 [Flavisolibacter sp. BT320]|nr:hypothetical protein [Flavisolibacter longurius]